MEQLSQKRVSETNLYLKTTFTLNKLTLDYKFLLIKNSLLHVVTSMKY